MPGVCSSPHPELAGNSSGVGHSIKNKFPTTKLHTRQKRCISEEIPPRRFNSKTTLTDWPPLRQTARTNEPDTWNRRVKPNGKHVHSRRRLLRIWLADWLALPFESENVLHQHPCPAGRRSSRVPLQSESRCEGYKITKLHDYCAPLLYHRTGVKFCWVAPAARDLGCCSGAACMCDWDGIWLGMGDGNLMINNVYTRQVSFSSQENGEVWRPIMFWFGLGVRDRLRNKISDFCWWEEH